VFALPAVREQLVPKPNRRLLKACILAICVAVPSVYADDEAPPLVESVSVEGTTTPVKLDTQVGQPYDTDVIDKDVHRLWKMGRFEDIRVESKPGASGTAVVFHVVEAPVMHLRQLLVEPNSYGLKMSLPAGTLLNRLRAVELAQQARGELLAKGYVDAKVDPEIVPTTGQQVDLRLIVKASDAVRVREIEFTGNPVLSDKELNGALHALHTRHIFMGWKFLPSYSEQAVDTDIMRLRSFYLTEGFLDANVRLDDTQIDGKEARLRIFVNAGPRYQFNQSPRDICTCLFKERREAEKQGILDFTAKLYAHPTDSDTAELTYDVERGKKYRVGRIDFVGNKHTSDLALRSNFLLDEGDLFDELLLRKSLARLNRTGLVEPVSVRSVAITTDDKTGLANVSIRVTENRHGFWNFSGPVGPISLAGPLQASIGSRLPSWGRGLFELSTYTASFSLLAFAHPILPALALTPTSRFLPVIALQRPFLPGQSWTSGFNIAPQLGWRISAFGYLTTQLQQRLAGPLNGDRGMIPDLTIMVDRPNGDVPLFCDPPKPRFAVLRTTTALGLQFLGALATF